MIDFACRTWGKGFQLILSQLEARPTPASFKGLGDLPGGIINSYPNGLSVDGNVVVGGSYSANGNEAFRWTSSEGMIPLGDLSGGNFASVALDASFDGAVVVGGGHSIAGYEPFRWTSATGMISLGTASSSQFVRSNDVSSDGAVIVGARNDLEAFRWTASSGM